MTNTESVSLEDQIKQLAKEEGAALVGICSADSLKDKEISDPNFLLPGAQSVISIAIPFSDKAAKNYLGKIERDTLNIEDDQITKVFWRKTDIRLITVKLIMATVILE